MAKRKKRDWEQSPMFEALPPGPPPAQRVLAQGKKKHADHPLWTEKKALLIRDYLYLFLQITHHGTYIDGFAGPQYPDIRESCAAELVADMEPAWLRNLHFFELDSGKVALLEPIRARHAGRVTVYPGDFNLRVEEILRPDVIPAREATFCLLDQQTFECHWATVQRLARYPKDRFKTEIFYFLANSWFDRAVAAVSTGEGRARVNRWWGGPEWERLRALRGMDRALVFAARFQRELGYLTAIPYAIYQREHAGGHIMYWMIHAADHPEASALMDRAHMEALKPDPPDQVTLYDLLK